MLFLRAAAVFAAAAACVADPVFSDWLKINGKHYSSAEERLLRSHIFAANVAKINAHNALNASWTMSVNKFADLTAAEFEQRMASGLRGRVERNESTVLSAAPNGFNGSIPTSIDWTTKGAVTPVKDQDECGSCWSFGVTGVLEGFLFITSGDLISLSEQELIDCSTPFGNHGCDGGRQDNGFAYVVASGLTSDSYYPYRAVDGTCESSAAPSFVKISGYTNIAQADSALMNFIARSPITVSIDASSQCFQFYSSGVLDCPSCGNSLGHAVLAVGYGEMNGDPYYKVKNSWGLEWGNRGYINMLRGSNAGIYGECGILGDASCAEQ